MLLAVGVAFCLAGTIQKSPTPWLTATIDEPAVFSGKRAWDHLLAQVELGPRDPGSRPHEKTLELLESRLRGVTERVLTDTFSGNRDGRPVKLTNLQADLGPICRHPILLAAHWDTRPWADRDPDPRSRHLPIPGANDGASGVAILLEVARVLRPQIPVRVLFFDGEDLGRELGSFFQGSRRFAAKMGGDRPRWGILVDMVGDRDLMIEREAFSREAAPELLALVWQTAWRIGLGSVFSRRDGPPIYDDHWPLIQQGIPMINLIDFSYPAWHTTSDTPEQCAAASLEAVGRVIVEVVNRANIYLGFPSPGEY